MMKHVVKWCAAVAIMAATAPVAQAQSSRYDAAYVFGDSLSDRGNLAEYLGGNLPSPPFYHDSFTNGDVAVQVMARALGLSADPSLFVTGFADRNHLGLTTGTNYAVAGATAGTLAGVAGANLPNQIAAYLAHAGQLADPNALYTVFIGGNDVRTAAHQGDAAFVTTGAATEIAGVGQLVAAGARNILVVNVPDIGVIPEFQLLYPAQVASASSYTVQYNATLASGITTLSNANPTVSIRQFDLYDYRPDLAALGITDTVDPCYTNTSVTAPSAATSSACGPIDPATGQATNIGHLQYWDYIHPTGVVQSAIGNTLASFVLSSAAVPEPGTWLMMTVGMGFAGATLRRRRNKALRASQAG